MTGSAGMAQVSYMLVFSALVVYVGALVGFCAEWAFGTRSRMGRRAASANAKQQRTPALAGAAAAGALASPRPPAPTYDGRVDEPVSPRTDISGRIGVALTLLGFLLHVAGTLTRGLAAERVPLGNMYEFASAGVLAVVGAFLFLLVRQQDRSLGMFVMLPVTLGLGATVTLLYTEVDQLVPALQSYWLGIHVSAAVLCTGVFTLGAIASGLYLVHARLEARTDREASLLSTAWRHLPDAAALDRMAHRTAAFVFPMWTFAILAGAIWAENAWGRYWGWDPKETWAFITWVVYAAYLHARSTAGWKGSRAAWVNLLGYGCFLFNFVGVNVFVTGLHSYAGI
ncbi:c-type cytochrome biogenesis protein CcsB [Streptomyces sp. PSKA54]|uniref:C-type cytochrome biogenesis protein CcsB n=1 Tax=Streptomyces himalayensis subsp. aureolus TaxID=2758039 RepID=A0A7W2D457_9ACTN|nr:c-type cytochrome biogenesis protein CcsB [Streptomyces himalayensis]MBA4864296.1 c-type cytochrome biogenesis protein CcsB [Streptomyces himalayensis subsp. aureolus]